MSHPAAAPDISWSMEKEAIEEEAIEEEGMVCGSSCQSSGPMTLLRRGGGAGAKVASTQGLVTGW